MLIQEILNNYILNIKSKNENIKISNLIENIINSKNIKYSCSIFINYINETEVIISYFLLINNMVKKIMIYITINDSNKTILTNKIIYLNYNNKSNIYVVNNFDNYYQKKNIYCYLDENYNFTLYNDNYKNIYNKIEINKIYNNNSINEINNNEEIKKLLLFEIIEYNKIIYFSYDKNIIFLKNDLIR